MLLSVVLGLALALFFYKATCSGGRCLVIGKKPRLGVESNVHMDTDGTCYRFDKFQSYCQFPIAEGETDIVRAGGYQDPGYGSGQGSIGASYEGFGADGYRPEEFTSGCLGHDATGTEYPNSPPFHQMACKPEPKWNLPRDARVFHQAKYPCGVPGQCDKSSCYKHHPMDTVFTPPNEGIMMN